MPSSMSDQLREAVAAASVRTEVCQAVGELYGQLQRNIQARGPICQASGRCCRFDEFGHRLYVTTMELAAFAHQFKSAGPAALSALADWTQTDRRQCPFQIDRLCSVHTIRPFGCRVYFCDATATQWQQEQYELFHGQLKRLHQALGVAYFYLEWRESVSCAVFPIDQL